MQKIRVSKRYRPARWRLEPLASDPLDRDIIRAKQLAGRSLPSGAVRRARDAGPDREGPDAGDRHA